MSKLSIASRKYGREDSHIKPPDFVKELNDLEAEAFRKGALWIIQEAQLRVDECRNRGMVTTRCQTALQLLEFLESLTEES